MIGSLPFVSPTVSSTAIAPLSGPTTAPLLAPTDQFESNAQGMSASYGLGGMLPLATGVAAGVLKTLSLPMLGLAGSHLLTRAISNVSKEEAQDAVYVHSIDDKEITLHPMVDKGLTWGVDALVVGGVVYLSHVFGLETLGQVLLGVFGGGIANVVTNLCIFPLRGALYYRALISKQGINVPSILKNVGPNYIRDNYLNIFYRDRQALFITNTHPEKGGVWLGTYRSKYIEGKPGGEIKWFIDDIKKHSKEYPDAFALYIQKVYQRACNLEMPAFKKRELVCMLMCYLLAHPNFSVSVDYVLGLKDIFMQKDAGLRETSVNFLKTALSRMNGEDQDKVIDALCETLDSYRPQTVIDDLKQGQILGLFKRKKQDAKSSFIKGLTNLLPYLNLDQVKRVVRQIIKSTEPNSLTGDFAEKIVAKLPEGFHDSIPVYDMLLEQRARLGLGTWDTKALSKAENKFAAYMMIMGKLRQIGKLKKKEVPSLLADFLKAIKVLNPDMQIHAIVNFAEHVSAVCGHYQREALLTYLYDSLSFRKLSGQKRTIDHATGKLMAKFGVAAQEETVESVGYFNTTVIDSGIFLTRAFSEDLSPQERVGFISSMLDKMAHGSENDFQLESLEQALSYAIFTSPFDFNVRVDGVSLKDKIHSLVSAEYNGQTEVMKEAKQSLFYRLLREIAKLDSGSVDKVRSVIELDTARGDDSLARARAAQGSRVGEGR